MAKPPRRPQALQNRIFRGANALGLGLLTRASLRSSAWQQLFRGIYADRTIAITHQMRCLAVSEYLLPAGGAIAGRSAAHLHGVPYVDVGDPVEVLTPKDFGPVQGLLIHRGPLDPADVGKRRRIRVTTPLRTCWDLARWLDATEAVVFLDHLVAKHVVTVASIVEYAQAKPGGARLRKIVPLVDPGAESPQESRLRVNLVLAGIPKPVTQFVISKGGRFVARIDLAWPQWKVALEYDGYWHGDRAQLERDRRRLNAIVGEDWIVLHVTAQRMRDDFPAIVREIRDAIAKRSTR